MEQKRFEVGKTDTEDDNNKIGIEIKVLSRTEKTIPFIYTKKIGGSRKQTRNTEEKFRRTAENMK